MLVVHHLNNSRSQRVLWLLEELGVSYDVRRYHRDSKTMLAPPELTAVHPLGKSPVITDDGQTIAESGAIVEYIIERYAYGRLIPAPATPERLRYTYWLHYAEGSAMPPLLLKLVFDRLEKSPAPFFLRPVLRSIARKAKTTFVIPQLETHLAFMENELRNFAWFAGDAFTAADIQMSFPVEAAEARAGLSKRAKPRLYAYLERIHARPAYQRAIDRGGPFQAASG